MTQQRTNPGNVLVDEEARANIFGFPLVLMDVTREVATAVPSVDEQRKKAPVNQLVHLREFPNASFTDVVSPNADTLYSFGFLDLKKEPMILSVPEMGDRYYLMELLDAWTNVFGSPGTRTTGNGKGSFAIVGPSWKGSLPDGVKVIRSPTNMVWIIGRTQTNGKADYAAVHALQDQYKLVPLSAWGTADYKPPAVTPFSPNVDTKTAPVEQVARMDAATFFARLNALMIDNPPTPADADAMKRFAKVGVVPGKGFDSASVDRAVWESAEQGVREGFKQIIIEAKKDHGAVANGWQTMSDVGDYGTDYLWRAVVALIGLGANLPEDAVYPHATVDADGQPLTGANRYIMRFAKEKLPPVRAFWSVTMYNRKQFFVDNPIDRYAIGDRSGLVFDPDGGLTLYIQSASPGKGKESNWLPAPKDEFNLFLRLYWPKQEILDGTWVAPPVERVG